MRSTDQKVKEQSRLADKQEGIVESDGVHTVSQSHKEGASQTPVFVSENQVVPSSMAAVDLSDLVSAIAALRTKLEIVQPDGLRPSDIAKVKERESRIERQNNNLTISGDIGEDTSMEESGDVVLSQVAISQQSILLWDDLQLLVEASTSISEQEQSLVSYKATLLMCRK